MHSVLSDIGLCGNEDIDLVKVLRLENNNYYYLIVIILRNINIVDNV